MTQIGTFDFTIFQKHMDIEDPNRIITILRPIFKNWVFQYELTQKGEVHIQMRARLWKRKRMDAALKFFNENGLHGHCSATSTPAHKSKTFNYVMKADSRAPGYDGPYSDIDDEEPKEKFSYIEEYESFEVKRPFQIQLDHIIAGKADRRTINLIVDPSGCSGKSLWQQYQWYTRDALQVPDMTDTKDIMQFCMSFKPKSLYIMNFPRAFDRKMRGTFAALESLKDGYLYETRYRGQIRYQEPPHVLVFCNEVPDINYLSMDRWRIWGMNRQTFSLVDITAGFLPEYAHSAYEDFWADVEERFAKRRLTLNK